MATLVVYCAMSLFTRLEAQRFYPTLANFLPEHRHAQGQPLQITPALIERLDAELMQRMYAKSTYVRQAGVEYLALSVPFIGQTVPSPFRLYFDKQGRLERIENDNTRILHLNEEEELLLQALWHALLSDSVDD